MKAALYPKMQAPSTHTLAKPKLSKVPITDIFNIDRGDFHAISKLQPGDSLTISRVSTDNGNVGFFAKPAKAKNYEPKTVTISTVTGDAFMQVAPFIATDNVLICLPKQPLRTTSLLYLQAAINNVKWRYSYGRQPYIRIFKKTILSVPLTHKGELDEQYMAAIVTKNRYFGDLVRRAPSIK